MTNHQTINHPRFYLLTTDLLQGISIFIMVIGHTGLWWDSSLDTKYPNLPLLPLLLIIIAFIVPPGFLFWYSFNSVNSLLQRQSESERSEARSRLIKRAIIFFLIGEIGELVTALVVSRPILNYILTWELFHMFSLSTIFVLFSFEFIWRRKRSKPEQAEKLLIFILIGIICGILAFFLIFHDYSQSNRFTHAIELNLESFLRRLIFEEGQTPIIPFAVFPLLAIILGVYMNLPNENSEQVVQKAKIPLLSGAILFLIGLLLVDGELYASTPVFYPASSNFVFIAMGTLYLTCVGGILLLDLKPMFRTREIHPSLLPIILMSRIVLTIYFTHNLGFAIPNELGRMLIPNIEVAMAVGLLYTLFFIMIAVNWQKYDFHFSLEWWLLRLQRAQWQWWNKESKAEVVS